MKHLIFLLSLLFCLSILPNQAIGQDIPSNPEEYEKQYLKNIRKSRLNGVYIPKDMKDAIKELTELSPSEGVAKFKNAPIDKVVRKMHFGLGHWMRLNWNFEFGSRFSHYLKSLGVSHPDDMIEFTLISWHKDLNGQELNLKARGLEYAKGRKAQARERFKDAEVVEKRKLDKPKSDQ